MSDEGTGELFDWALSLSYLYSPNSLRCESPLFPYPGDSLSTAHFSSSRFSHMHVLFSEDIFLLLLFCFLIKLAFFAYGVYSIQAGFSIKQDNIFIAFTSKYWHLEALNDFDNDYLLWRDLWLQQEPLYSDAFLGRYRYPPLYFFLIHIFAPWTVYSAPLVMLLCSLFTGYFLYCLVRSFGASVLTGKLMLLLTLLSPLSLFYSDYIWQNAGVVTAFLVFVVFQIAQGHHLSGVFWLGIAMGIKQVAFFAYPFCIIAIAYAPLHQNPKQGQIKLHRSHRTVRMVRMVRMVRTILQNFPLKRVLLYGSIPLGVFLLVSWPYLHTDPQGYIDILFNYHKVTDYAYIQEIYSQIVPVKTGAGDLLGYFPDLTINPGNRPYRYNYRSSIAVACAWIGNVFHLPESLTIGIALLFSANLFLYAFTALVGIRYWVRLATTRSRSGRAYYWQLWNFVNLAIFGMILFSRVGIYKYYFLSLVPAWASFGIFGAFATGNHNHWQTAANSPFWTPLNRGGALFHLLEQFIFQMLLLYSHRWLLPVCLYLPLYLLWLGKLMLPHRFRYRKILP